jgi:hypothetical protein
MSAQYRLTFSVDYLITANWRKRQQFRGRYWFHGLQWLLASMLLVVGVYSAAVAKIWMILPFAIVACFLLMTWPVDKWRMRMEHRRSLYRDNSFELTVSEDGVVASGLASEVKLDWSAFTKARRFEDGLLLFRGPQIYWLPDIAGSTPEAWVDALHIARINVRDFRDL